MSGFRTILVGADFSPLSEAVFHQACSLAEKQLIVLHVVEPTLVPRWPATIGTPDVPWHVGPVEPPDRASTCPEELLHRRDFEDRLRGLYAPDRPVPTEYRLGYGLPSNEILRVAEEVGADLIALGAYGRGGLAGLLMGSTAEAVMRRSRCPVLALRPHGDRRGGAEPNDREFALRPIRIILHPTDFSRRSEPALELAASLARDRGARLIIVHVAPDPACADGPPSGPDDPRTCRRRLRDIRARQNQRGLAAPVEVALRHGDPAGAILRAADEFGADLIVMGTHGRTGLRRLLMGSVAEGVLHGARCPVLTVKAPFPTAVPSSPQVISASI